jgi:hypothetical protein
MSPPKGYNPDLGLQSSESHFQFTLPKPKAEDFDFERTIPKK